MEQASQSLGPGDRLGQYRVLEAIGAGGMGEVVLAEDETLGRRVALKSILGPNRLDPEVRARFLREARVLSSLDHPGVCRIYDFLRSPGRDVLVLEYVDGETLGSRIRSGLSAKEALAIAEQLCDALAAAHSAGVVHRDLKPGNILVTADNVVRVLDFGLARSAVDAAPQDERPREPDEVLVDGDEHVYVHLLDEDAATPDLTAAGSILGTLQYMAPEQAQGAAATTATDCFSLGLVLQELFTGRAAFGSATSLDELLSAVQAGRVAPIEGVDREVAQLVRDLQNEWPGQRPSAQDCLRRIRRIQERPARRLRNLVAASVLAAGVLGTLKYTLDLRAARDAAQAAREDASERAASSYGLVQDLLSKQVPVLRELDRLDAMRPAVEGVSDYFARFDAGDLDPGERTQQAQLLNLVGEVALEMGSVQAAHDNYAEALELAQLRTVEAPDEPDAWLALGDAHFYLAQVQTLALDHAGALASQQAYLDAARTQLALRPEDRAARTNLGWAHTAVGAALIPLERLDEAEQETRLAEEVFRLLVVEDPTDSEALSNLADAVSWLGSVAFEARDFEEALRRFGEELELRRRIFEQGDGSNYEQRLVGYAEERLLRTYRDAGRVAEAVDLAHRTVDSARARSDADPRSADRRQDLALALYTLGNLEVDLGQNDAGRERLRESATISSALTSLDANNRRWWTILRRTHLALARYALDSLELDEAETSLAVVRTASERLGPSATEDTRGLVDTVFEHILTARLLAEGGAYSEAEESWRDALARLPADLESVAGAEVASLHALRAEAHLSLGEEEAAQPSVDWLRAQGTLEPRLKSLLDE